jgi:CBS domain-containing protein
MKTVGEIVRGRGLLYVDAQATVFEAAAFMDRHLIGAVPILEEGRLVGVFSERDLMTRVVVPGGDPRATRIKDVMTRDLVVAEPADTYEKAGAKMVQRGCRHLPVVDGERLLGFLSLRDLLQVEIEEQAQSLAMMTHYVQYIPPEVEERFRDATS